MIGDTYLELKLLKNPFFKKGYFYNNKVLKNNKGLPKLFNKKIYFTLLSNIIIHSTKYNLSN